MSLDEHAATELEMYIDNDGRLYEQMTQGILKNLVTRMVKGTFNKELSKKSWANLIEAGAKKYAKEFASPSDWNKIFSVETRKHLVNEYADAFVKKYERGEFNYLIPEKHKKA